MDFGRISRQLDSEPRRRRFGVASPGIARHAPVAGGKDGNESHLAACRSQPSGAPGAHGFRSRADRRSSDAVGCGAARRRKCRRSSGALPSGSQWAVLIRSGLTRTAGACAVCQRRCFGRPGRARKTIRRPSPRPPATRAHFAVCTGLGCRRCTFPAEDRLPALCRLAQVLRSEPLAHACDGWTSQLSEASRCPPGFRKLSTGKPVPEGRSNSDARGCS
ncbi:hypothetical protein OKW38_000615 [Paraburkholderia sp. MM5496-R1]